MKELRLLAVIAFFSLGFPQMRALASSNDDPAKPPAASGAAWPWGEPPPWGGETFAHWKKWTHGMDVSGGYLGHFASASTDTAPPGSLMFEGRYHLWLDHLYGTYVIYDQGINGTSMAGAGVMVNLVEVLQNPVDPLAGGGGHRGVFGSAVQNFMIYGAVDFVRYFLPPPDHSLGQAWGSGSFSVRPTVGAQWYFSHQDFLVQRYYIELSGTAAIVDGDKFVAPMLRLGIEFK